jgi:putative hydrolases of HD superfamily
MSIEKDLELLYEIGCLRYVDRTWKQFLGLDVANISEHTFRTMWTALILAKREGVQDIEKLMKMALVHDLSESRTGDAHYLSHQFVNRFEDKAIAESLKETSLEELKQLWDEYEKRESIISKIVRDADLLDVEIEINELHSKGHKVAEDWKKFRDQTFVDKLSTDSAREIWKAIQNSNPHDWHLKGSNRFNVKKNEQDESKY